MVALGRIISYPQVLKMTLNHVTNSVSDAAKRTERTNGIPGVLTPKYPGLLLF